MITDTKKQEFIDRGFLQLTEVVPRGMCDAALQAINHSIGNVGKTGGDPERFTVDQFCYELAGQPMMIDVFNKTGVRQAADALMGEGCMLPVERVQIAPRFPLAPGEEPPSLHGHIDGIGGGSNGTAKGSYIRTFTLFAVVYLADVPETESGNFTVWPGSHWELQEYFREVGHEVLSQGVPHIHHAQEPVMITGKAGDVVLAHHLLQHEGGYNLSPNVRHALISRLRHRDWAAPGYDAYTNIWDEWIGLKELRN